MLSSIDIEKSLHHAYLLVGEKEFVFQELQKFLNEKLNFSTISNPDFWLGEFDNFGIDDGRLVKDFQSKKAFSGGKKILIIRTNFLTHEAQNSLLKVFEEPTDNTHLFLIVPSAENLLSTLKSRLMILKDLDVGRPNIFGGEISKLGVEKFLKGNISKRFELIKVFLPKSKEDRISKSEIINFLNELEEFLYKNKKLVNIDLEDIFFEIRQCRSYLSDRSPAVKMILEHLSQIIPIIHSGN